MRRNDGYLLAPMVALMVFWLTYGLISYCQYSVKVIPNVKIESATAKVTLGNEVREVSAEVKQIDKDTWKITVPRQVFHNVVCYGEVVEE